ncbi:MAG TPA: hypothetical protein VGN52_10580 [Burkholderiales bacterium]|jgi:hypothetical protein
MSQNNVEHLRQTVVGLADLIRDVRTHGPTARFEMRAPGLLEEARLVLMQSAAPGEPNPLGPGVGAH